MTCLFPECPDKAYSRNGLFNTPTKNMNTTRTDKLEAHADLITRPGADLAMGISSDSIVAKMHHRGFDNDGEMIKLRSALVDRYNSHEQLIAKRDQLLEACRAVEQLLTLGGKINKRTVLEQLRAAIKAGGGR